MTTSDTIETVLAAISTTKTETDATIAGAEYRMEAALQAARDQGATWEQIGHQLGITRQGAMQKYAAKLKQQKGRVR